MFFCIKNSSPLSSSEEEEDSGSSSWSMNVGAEAAETTGWCGGDGGGTETALPAMRASSLASLDEDGLEFDERCCTMSSPAADIAAVCSQTGSGRAPEASRRSNRRRTHAPVSAPSSPHGAGADKASSRVDLPWPRAGREPAS